MAENDNNTIKMGKSSSKFNQTAETPSKKKRQQKKWQLNLGLDIHFDEDVIQIKCSPAPYVNESEDDHPFVRLRLEAGEKTSSEKHLDDVRTCEIAPQPRVQRPAGPAPPPPDVLDN